MKLGDLRKAEIIERETIHIGEKLRECNKTEIDRSTKDDVVEIVGAASFNRGKIYTGQLQLDEGNNIKRLEARVQTRSKDLFLKMQEKSLNHPLTQITKITLVKTNKSVGEALLEQVSYDPEDPSKTLTYKSSPINPQMISQFLPDLGFNYLTHY